MEVCFDTRERQFLVNTLLNQDVATPLFDTVMARSVASVLQASPTNDFTTQQVGFLQYVLQTQLEIMGSLHTTANEKRPILPSIRFFPHRTMVLIKRISVKLGMKLKVDIETRSDQTVGRTEGSTWIVTDPQQSPVGITPVVDDL